VSRINEEMIMPEYIPSPRQWVREQVELYERSGGTEGTTLRDTGLPVIIVTHTGSAARPLVLGGNHPVRDVSREGAGWMSSIVMSSGSRR
jgi:hypothetical protein